MIGGLLPSYSSRRADVGQSPHTCDSPSSGPCSGRPTRTLGAPPEDRPGAGPALQPESCLASAAGKSDLAVAAELGTTRVTVGKWRRRFLQSGCDGLLDEARPGTPRTVSDADVERVVTTTLESMPRDATHWSTRSMARVCGLSAATTSAASGGRSPCNPTAARPSSCRRTRCSQGRESARYRRPAYLHPPERAVRLVRRREVADAGPGPVPNRCCRCAREKVCRNGARTTTGGTGRRSLFAALNVATGKVLAQCHRRHRAVEFIKFLRAIDKAVPADQDIHVVLDNYGTHKTAMIHQWLARQRPRFTCTSPQDECRRGSTWSSAGSPCSPRSRSAGATHRSTAELERAPHRLPRHLRNQTEDPRVYCPLKDIVCVDQDGRSDPGNAPVHELCARISDSGH